MKRIIYSFSMMAALFCLASCSEKMNLEQHDVTNIITVTTQVDPHTKAGYETSETVTVLPEKFYIEIDQDGNDKDYRLPLTREPNTNNYQASIELQWNGTDHTNTKVKAMTIPYGLTSVDMEKPMPIAINKEQGNSENLKASDLLGASTTIGGIAIQDNNINIAFKHLMSKLQITYTKPDDIQINSVQLKNTCVKGGYSYASMAYDSSIAAEFGDITMYHEAEKKSAEAIFFPYAPTSDPKLVVNATINGQTKAFECPIVLKQSSAFVGGKRYIMTVTVSETGIEGVVTMIKDWNPSGDNSSIANEKILWIGTSIPAGNGVTSYPAIVDDALSCSIRNNAYGGSVVLEAEPKWKSAITFETWNYLYAGALSQTLAEAEEFRPLLIGAASKVETIKDADGNDIPVNDATREAWVTEQMNLIKSLSYESLIIPYINGEIDNCTTVIIDHGFNDMGRLVLEAQPFGSYPGYENSDSDTEWGYNFLTALKNGEVTFDQYKSYLEPFWNNSENILTEEYSYIIAMKKVIDAIYAVSEDIKIIIGNYFATDSPYANKVFWGNGFDQYQLTQVLLYYNEAVAGMFDLDIVNVYQQIHIDKGQFWNPELNTTNADPTKRSDPTKFCPDGVHPTNEYAVQAIADVWIRALRDILR